MTDTTVTTTEAEPATAIGGTAAATTTDPDTGRTVDAAQEAEKWKELARKHEKDAKANAAAAKRLAEIEASQMTEQEKANAASKELETRAVTAESELARVKAAIEAELPLEFADRLKGSTHEELVADAKKLAEVFGKKPATTTQAASFDGGVRGEGGVAPQDAEAWLREHVAAKRQ